MNIIIVGAGMVGVAIAEKFRAKDANITFIDKDYNALEAACERVDASKILGSAMDFRILRDAGIIEADFLVAMTGSDELNLLLCIIARREKKEIVTIAKFHDDILKASQRNYLRQKLEISFLINPEYKVANELSRLILNPPADEANAFEASDLFVKDKIQLVSTRIPLKSPFVGKTIKDCCKRFKGKLLVCAIEREGDIIIPGGDTVFNSNDRISIVASSKDLGDFYKKARISNGNIKKVVIVGATVTAYYLSKLLIHRGVKVAIVEKSKAAIEMFKKRKDIDVELFSADATDARSFFEEDLDKYDAFVALSNSDENNIALSLLAKDVYKMKPFVKINTDKYEKIVSAMTDMRFVHTKDIVAERVEAYIKSKLEAEGNSEIISRYNLLGGRVFAVEFTVGEKSEICKKEISSLTVRNGNILGCVGRNGRYFVPSGDDTIESGDNVVVLTTNSRLRSLESVFEK